MSEKAKEYFKVARIAESAAQTMVNGILAQIEGMFFGVAEEGVSLREKMEKFVFDESKALMEHPKIFEVYEKALDKNFTEEEIGELIAIAQNPLTQRVSQMQNDLYQFLPDVVREVSEELNYNKNIEAKVQEFLADQEDSDIDF